MTSSKRKWSNADFEEGLHIIYKPMMFRPIYEIAMSKLGRFTGNNWGNYRDIALFTNTQYLEIQEY